MCARVHYICSWSRGCLYRRSVWGCDSEGGWVTLGRNKLTTPSVHHNLTIWQILERSTVIMVPWWQYWGPKYGCPSPTWSLWLRPLHVTVGANSFGMASGSTRLFLNAVSKWVVTNRGRPFFCPCFCPCFWTNTKGHDMGSILNPIFHSSWLAR